MSNILFSFEVPKSLLESSLEFNNFNYFLDIFDDTETESFYQKEKIKKSIIYLDNSLYERNLNNVPFKEMDFFRLARRINSDNTYVMAPDFYEDSFRSLESLKKYKDFNEFKLIGIPHGKNKRDFIDCFIEMDKILNKNEIIALTAGDSFFKEISRTEIIKELIDKNLINRRIHILGLRSPKEILELREVKDYIFSLDTSLPVISTILNRDIEEVIEENIKPSLTIYEVYNKCPEVDLDLLQRNTSKFKSYFRKKTL